MSALKKSSLVFLGNIMLFLALGFGGWFLVTKISAESAETAAASAHIALLQEKEREFDESSSNLTKYDAKIQRLNRVFLTESTFVEFLKTMEGLAKKAGVEFKAVNAALPTAANDKAVLTFTLEGRTAELVRFFILLDHVPYSGVVGQMQWVRQGKGSETVKVSADYTIFNYAK